MEEKDIKGFFKKNKADGLVSGNIDNTAPVKKIIEQLEESKSQSLGFIKFTRFPYYHKKSNETSYKHFQCPGLMLASFPDDWEGDLSFDYFEPFRYKCMQPKMMTPMPNRLKQDPLTAFLKVKQKWLYDLTNQKRACVRYKTPLLDQLKEHSDNVISCPKHLLNMAQHWDSDPDPYFSSSYNWYYAGNGNMQRIWVENKEYLMCSEFHCCYLFKFNRNRLTYNRDAAAVFNCGEGSNICESIWSLQDIIALRTKHKIFVLKIVVIYEKIEIQLLKVSESKMAYTGISFDEHHRNILYVTDLGNTLKIVNLDRLTARTVELKNSVKTLVNNWATVVSNERTYYTHVTTNALTLYDKRVNSPVRRWSNPNKVADEAICNIITAAKYSRSGPYLYLATNHHLLLMDMRCQRNSSLKPLQRWTHGMQSAPSYISISPFEHEKELICLTSQWIEDTCVVPNYLQSDWSEPEFKGITVPYRLPSLLKPLYEARLQSLCTDVYSMIEDRLVTALSGSVLLQEGERYVVLSQNSLGDVTSHVLYPEHMTPPEDDAAQALHEWSRDYEVKQTEYVMSCVKDIKNIWTRLENVPEGEIDKKYENEPTNFSKQEVMEAFENEELEEALLDVWMEKEEANSKISSDMDDKSESSLSLHVT